MHLTGPMALNAPTNTGNMDGDLGALLSEFGQMQKTAAAMKGCASGVTLPGS
jgi:hypothetical protein